MKAANVFLTNTDSMILGINGGGLWSRGLPVLNSGTWNPGQEMCLDLDLSNLPGSGLNLLPIIQMAGHLDVSVQDDTAVDYLELSMVYEECQRCIPKLSVMSHLYTGTTVQDFNRVKDCDCVLIGDCTRYTHYMTYYGGTSYETTIDIGSCLGRCPRFMKCDPVYISKYIKAPEGLRSIQVVDECKCGKLTWNPTGVYDQRSDEP